jgi:hypothetical protein
MPQVSGLRDGGAHTPHTGPARSFLCSWGRAGGRADHASPAPDDGRADLLHPAQRPQRCPAPHPGCGLTLRARARALGAALTAWLARADVNSGYLNTFLQRLFAYGMRVAEAEIKEGETPNATAMQAATLAVLERVRLVQADPLDLHGAADVVLDAFPNGGSAPPPPVSEGLSVTMGSAQVTPIACAPHSLRAGPWLRSRARCFRRAARRRCFVLSRPTSTSPPRDRSVTLALSARRAWCAPLSQRAALCAGLHARGQRAHEGRCGT